MLAPSETLGSSNTTLLIFHISPIEAEANIDQLFEHTFFKKILKHNKKKNILKVLYHSLPFVFNSVIISNILAADIFSTSAFACASAW